MDGLEEVDEGWLVGFPGSGEDAGVDYEHVSSLCEMVFSSGAEDSFAEFTHREEDVGEFFF